MGTGFRYDVGEHEDHHACHKESDQGPASDNHPRSLTVGVGRVNPSTRSYFAQSRLAPAGSVGVAMINQQTVSDEQVLAEADRAMYVAKQAKATATPV